MKPLYRQALESALIYSANLELASPPQVSGLDGRRSGRRSGNALEFAEYREYQAGDDLRRLDWGVFARSEQLMVKLYSEEVDPRCDLVLDHSASMAGVADVKAAAALGLTAILAQAAVNTGFSLAVWHAGEGMEREPAPSHPLEWRNLDFTARVSPGESFERFGGAFQPRGIRIAITDLLWPEEPELFLRRLTDGAMRTAVIELQLGEDRSPAGSGNTLIYDVENGEERELFLEEGVLRRYRERLARHRELWDRAAQEFGIQLIRLTVEDIYPAWQLDELFRWGILK